MKRSRPRRSRDPLRLDDLVGGEGRAADVADLPGAHEIGQRAERLVDVGVGLGAVDLVEVDPVRLEAPQAVLDRARDPAARVAELVRIVAHLAVELGGQHDVVALAARQGLADDLLGLAARVDVGGVDEVDPGVERGVDDPDRLVVVGVAPGAEHHGAEAEWADLDSGAAECAVFHASRLQGCARKQTAQARARRADDGPDGTRRVLALPNPQPPGAVPGHAGAPAPRAGHHDGRTLRRRGIDQCQGRLADAGGRDHRRRHGDHRRRASRSPAPPRAVGLRLGRRDAPTGARVRHRADGRPEDEPELPARDPGADGGGPLLQPRPDRRSADQRRAGRGHHPWRRPGLRPRQSRVDGHPALARALHRGLREPAGRLGRPPPRRQHARPAHRAAEPPRARAALRRGRGAGGADPAADQRRARRHRPLQAHQRRARPRDRRRGPARRRLRDAPQPAQLRAPLPARRRGVPAAAPWRRRR